MSCASIASPWRSSRSLPELPTTAQLGSPVEQWRSVKRHGQRRRMGWLALRVPVQYTERAADASWRLTFIVPLAWASRASTCTAQVPLKCTRRAQGTLAKARTMAGMGTMPCGSASTSCGASRRTCSKDRYVTVPARDAKQSGCSL
eukprot:scaffold2840_cov379-Prasinococcus_capsulatus_cf.AAC.5